MATQSEISPDIGSFETNKWYKVQIMFNKCLSAFPAQILSGNEFQKCLVLFSIPELFEFLWDVIG